MDDSEKLRALEQRIAKLRAIMNAEGTSSESLNSGELLRISKELDELIIEYMQLRLAAGDKKPDED